MERDLYHLRRQAERARQWACWTPDSCHRARIEAAAYEYEQMAAEAEQRDDPGASGGNGKDVFSRVS
jgi:hypothetical protein